MINDRRRLFAVTIGEDGSLSEPADLQGAALVGIYMPALPEPDAEEEGEEGELEGGEEGEGPDPADFWTAAAISFRASPNGEGDWSEVYSPAGVAVAVTVNAGQFVALSPETFLGARYLQVRSGTADNPVAQEAERTVILVAQPWG